MASEPAKVVGLTTGALIDALIMKVIDAYFEKPRQWDTNTQIHTHSKFLFCTAFR